MVGKITYTSPRDAILQIVVDSAIKSGLIEKENYQLINNIKIEVPRHAKYGHFSTNAAMVIQSLGSIKSQDIFDSINTHLKASNVFEEITFVKPGFINFTLKVSYIHGLFNNLLQDISLLTNISAPDPMDTNVNIEYVSANPTGPLHVGHARGAVVGDIMANLYEHCGYKVTREYYCNDAGSQVDVLAQSLFIRFQDIVNDTNTEIPKGHYPGEYLIDIAKDLYKEQPNILSESEDPIADIKSYGLKSIIQNYIQKDLRAMGINHDVWSSEKAIATDAEYSKMLTHFTDKDVVYKGTLETPKGIDLEEYDPREQILFRSTKYGDDSDRSLEKSNGERTYFANDALYHFNKFNRGFNKMIDVLGADHAGYASRIQAAVSAIDDKASLNVLFCAFVNLLENGKPVKMSKRSGNFFTLKDLIDRVGVDSIRFMMITRKNDVKLELDFSVLEASSNNNPVFYIQYAYARIMSVIRNYTESYGDIDMKNVDITLLNNINEMDAMLEIMSYRWSVLSALHTHDPHKLYIYLYKLASIVHQMWSAGKIDESARFIIDDNLKLSTTRVVLLKRLSDTMKEVFSIIGVSAPEKM